MAKHKKAEPQRRKGRRRIGNFDYIPNHYNSNNGYENGEGVVDDSVIEKYSTGHKQERLRRQIESQDLPVRNRLQELVDCLVEAYQNRTGIVLLQGETGSGKSVYSPTAMREALKKLGLKDKTVMMQPRRDAASGIARASAAVMREKIGQGVGFSTSEAKAISSHCNLAVVTPGIFLRYLMKGQLTKENVGAVIIDELHEGSVDYHLALGLIKMMREHGTAPLTLLTSATLDKEKIQNFFGINDEDYLRIEGRTYPVETYNMISTYQEEEKFNYIAKTAEVVKQICSSSNDPSDDGDILVFMPGRREIRETIKRLGTIEGVEILLCTEDWDQKIEIMLYPGIKAATLDAE